MIDPKTGERPTLSEVRHNLRTPLNQIIGYSQMLQEDAADRGQEAMLPDLQKIEAASRRLVELIDAYIQPGRLPVDPEPAGPPSPPRPEPEHTAQPRRAEPEESVADAAQTVLESLRTATGADGTDAARILVVDDDANNRDMLARRLQRKGFHVDAAEDGLRALTMVDEGHYHLLLLDVMMPGISGLDVLRQLRTRYSVADLPVIMATAMDQSEDVVQALRDGANDYVTKPLDFQVVLARVETQLALKRAKDQVHALAVELEVKNRFIRKTFGRFLSDEVVATLLESPEGLRLGGEKRRVTILMSDLRGFTSFADAVQPEQLVSILNTHLGQMADIIMSFGGTVDEFIGDSVLALFGAPMSRPDDAQRAVACAIAMQQAVVAANVDNRGAGLPELQMGIAINTGDVVVGNIGSQKRMKYGIVGSHVNLTSRLESLTVGGQVLISEGTLREAGELVRVRGEIAVRAKGFRDLITAYELAGIGNPFDMWLPQPEQDLVTLAEEIEVWYSLVEGKHVEATVHHGFIRRLSMHDAEVHSDGSPEKLTNLSIRLGGERDDRPDGEIYAKVIESTTDAPGQFTARFTWLPPQVEKFFQGLLARVG